jgi:DNA polymerase-3 subunit beta
MTLGGTAQAMRFVIERNIFLKALGHVTGIVERRNTIPILGNVLMTAKNGELTLKATDLDVEATEKAAAAVKAAGAVTISAHTLHDIVRKVPDGTDVEMFLNSGESRVTVSAGRARFALSILPADDFPDFGKTNYIHEFELAQADLRRLLEKTRFAISTEETRYYLNGVYLHTIDGAGGQLLLRAVATDGHRLARVEIEAPEGSAGMPGIIVPRKVVQEVIKLLGEDKAPVQISLSQSKIRFVTGTVILTSKLIDGSFPDYARVIPTSNSKTVYLDNTEFVKAVDRVSTLSSERGRAVKLNLAPEKMTLSVNNPDYGSATEELTAQYDGVPLEIGFNARYLLDIAGQIDGPRTEFKLADGSSPTLVADEADRSALYVIMPMRV